MSTASRVFQGKPAVFLPLLIGLMLLGFFAWPFCSQVPEHSPPIEQRILGPHDELYAIYFSSGGRGWAVGKFGTVLYTANGGKSWRQQDSGTTKPLTSVSFADDRHGFAVGGGGTILATLDGGRSWQPEIANTREHLLEVQAVSATAVFAVGAFGTVLSTNDGGVNWTTHKLPWQMLIPDIIRQTGDVEPNLDTVHFANAKDGWLGGEFGLILFTHDGGETWATQRAGSNLPQIAAIKFRDSSTGWAIGQKGTLLNTKDGGKTWQQIQIEGEADLYAMSVTAGRAAIVGDHATVLTCTDGLNWRHAELSSQNLWFSGVAISGENAFAVGQSGNIRIIRLDPQ